MRHAPLIVAGSLIARRVLRRSVSLADISIRTSTLCKAEVKSVPPAIYLKDSLERVSGVMSDTTTEQELRRIQGGKVEHAPTVVHTLARATLYRGCLYAGAWKRRLLERPAGGSRLNGDPWGEKTGALACTLYGSIYFGHWLRDDLSLTIAAESLDHPVVVSRPSYRHEPGYRRLLDLERRTCCGGTFERLLVLEDFSQNSFKGSRYRELRARLRSRFPMNGSELIYIRRGTVGARERRLLVNGAAVESFLTSRGFRIVDPDELSAEEIVRQIIGARLVISTEGSHLAHAAYVMADDSVVCVLQPPDRFNNVFKDYADCLDQRYAFVVGAPAEGGFVVTTDEIERTLASIEKQIRL
jgi:Glycosyltransferase 61